MAGSDGNDFKRIAYVLHRLALEELLRLPSGCVDLPGPAVWGPLKTWPGLRVLTQARHALDKQNGIQVHSLRDRSSSLSSGNHERSVSRGSYPRPPTNKAVPPKSSGSGRSGFLPSIQPALDHFQSSARATSPRRHRVVVNVLDHGQYRGRLGFVPVEAAAGLPEQIAYALAGFHRQAWQPVRTVLAQVPDGPTAHGLFDRLQNLEHVMRRCSGVNHKMDMLGHEHVRP